MTFNIEMVLPVANREAQCIVQCCEFQSMEVYLKKTPGFGMFLCAFSANYHPDAAFARRAKNATHLSKMCLPKIYTEALRI